MSLEAAIERNNELMEANNALLAKIVGQKPGTAATEDGEKKPTTRKKKAAEDTGSGDEGDDAVDSKKLLATREKVSGWLKEFAENEEDPENDARQEKLEAALAKIEVEKISTITSEATRQRVEKWIDARIEDGRITEEPAPKGKGKKAAADDI